MACNLVLPPSDLAGLPGGCPIDMGLGPIGGPNIVFKRKFRWTMEIEFCCENPDVAEPKCVPKEFVKLGSRPNIEIEETEINYLNGKFWIPGKATWQTITVTYYDVGGTAENLSCDTGTTTSLFEWIATIYDITNPTTLQMNSKPGCYEGVARILLYDGCGFPMEGWLLRHVWPTSINWGDLDMSSSEEVTIEMTLRYSEVEYQSLCPNQPIEPCPCCPCDDTACD